MLIHTLPVENNLKAFTFDDNLANWTYVRCADLIQVHFVDLGQSFPTEILNYLL